MGLLSNIGEKFSNTIWGSVNSMTNSIAENVNSFIYQGGAVLNTGLTNNNAGLFNTMDNDTFFDYLKDYHFTSAVLDILSSCLKDVISKSDFHVSITNDDDRTNRANNFIDSIQLKQFVLDNLRDMIYHGVYAFGIDYKDAKLYALDNPYDCYVLTNTKDVLGYEIGGSIRSNNNICCYYYQLDYIESIGKRNDDKNDYSMLNNNNNKDNNWQTKTTQMQEVDNNKSDNLGGYNLNYVNGIPEDIADLVVKFKKYKPYGLFNSKLFRIFQMFSIETALYFLSLRESMKPTLLGMTTSSGKQIDLANAINMANSIEDILNSPVTGLAQLNNPTVYMNQLTWTMLNNIRVMPTLDQYQNISDISQGDMSAKREKLAQELENIRKEILQELTIPEEIFGGSGSRWDQYSRSDRFITTIDTFLTSISNMVKQIICKLVGISTVSISFNIDTSSLVASFDVKNKLSQMSDKLSDLTRIIQSFKDVVENEYCVPTAAYEYLRNSIGAIDEKLLPIFIADLGQSGNENGGEDGDIEESSGGDDMMGMGDDMDAGEGGGDNGSGDNGGQFEL